MLIFTGVNVIIAELLAQSSIPEQHTFKEISSYNNTNSFLGNQLFPTKIYEFCQIQPSLYAAKYGKISTIVFVYLYPFKGLLLFSLMARITPRIIFITGICFPFMQMPRKRAGKPPVPHAVD